MAVNARVKITVLKRTINEDFLENYAESMWEPCERLREGQEFVAENGNMPADFCSWAWADMLKYVATLARGGNFVGVKPGHFVTCCTDGFRPVFFKLERLDEEV